MTKPVGRPTQYKLEYCKKIIDFFNIEPYRTITDKTITKKDGETIDYFKEVPSDPPFFSKFARKIGVSVQTLNTWTKKYPEFLEAYKEAKYLFKEYLITVGLLGAASTAFAIFTAKNTIGWRDNAIIDQSTHTHLTKVEVKVSDDTTIPLTRKAGLDTTRQV